MAKSMGMSIDQINVFDVNGLSIYSRIYKDVQVDQSLIAAFFSAIRQFAAHMMEGEIQGIKIGTLLLNFKVIPVENDSVVFLMISSGFSESTASEIADKLSETFAISFENFMLESGISYDKFKHHNYEHVLEFSNAFTQACDELVDDLSSGLELSLDLPIKIPSTVLKHVYEILQKKPALNDLYDHGMLDLLIETIQNYVFSGRITEDMDAKFKET